MSRQLPSTMWVLVAAGALAARISSVQAGEVVLEDDHLLAAFDRDSGALTRLENKTTHWTIERRPELGVSFRLLAPLPGRRDNFILGQQQHAAVVAKISDHQARLHWTNLNSEHSGVLPITFASEVTLTNGALTFAGILGDNSSVPVETVEYPYLGDLNPPARDSSLEAWYMKSGRGVAMQADQLYPHFSNEKGYWGVFYPTKMLESSPRDLYCLLQSPNEGICVEIMAPALPYRLDYYFEQHPGLVSSINNLVPAADDIGGLPVYLQFRTCHFVFAQPHSMVTLVPVVLACYSGDWRAGLKLCQQSRPMPAAR